MSHDFQFQFVTVVVDFVMFVYVSKNNVLWSITIEKKRKKNIYIYMYIWCNKIRSKTFIVQKFNKSSDYKNLNKQNIKLIVFYLCSTNCG